MPGLNFAITADNTNFIQRMNEVKQELQKTSEEVAEHSSLMVKMMGGYEKYQSVLGNLPGPLKNVITSINGMTGAAKAFIATPLGAIIGALVIALQALKSWFDSTAEGQLAFAEISGYVSGVLASFKEIVNAVGKAIYNAFKDPQKAVSDLWNAIKENIVNRFKSVGEMAKALGGVIKAALTFDGDALKSELKKLTDSFLQFGTGVENVSGKIGDWVNKTHEVAKATAEVSRKSKELQLEMSEWGIESQKLDTKKQGLSAIMYDTSKSSAERNKARKEFENIVAQQREMDLAFKDREIELHKQSMNLSPTSLEDIERLNQLEKEREAIYTKSAQQMANLQRRANSINNSGKSAAGQADHTAVTSLNADLSLSEYDKKLLKQQRNLGFEMEQARIDGMTDGFEKALAQNKLNYERLKADNDDKAEALVSGYREKLMAEFSKANPNASQSEKMRYKLKLETDITFDSLPQEIKDIISQYREMADASFAKANKEVLDDILKDVLTYEQQREKILKEYADKEAALYERDENGNIKGFKNGISQGNVDELRRQQDEAIQQIDEQFASREETYKAWCNQIANLSLEQLNQVLEQAKQELDNLEKSGTADSTQIATARAKVNTAQQAVNKAVAKNEVEGPNSKTLKQWGELCNLLNEAQAEFKALGSAFGGVVGEIMSKTGDIMSASMTMINGIMQLTQTGIFATKTAAVSAAASMSTLEKASIILTIISAAIQLAMMVASLFNSDKKHEKNIEALQDRIDSLQRSYDRLGRSIDKAYGKDASKLINQQEQLLRQRQALIRQQIMEEEMKKNSDDDRIKDWRNELEDLEDELADLKEKAQDAIFGADLQSAIEDFGEKYADAWASGESRALSAKETVKRMMQDMVKTAIKSAIEGSNAMQQIRDQLETFFVDNILDSAEQNIIYQMADKLQKDLDAQFGWADNLLSDDFSQSASSKGFAAMSQDSADELNGRFAALQESGAMIAAINSGIAESIKGMGDIQTMQREIMESSLIVLMNQEAHLETIAKHTKALLTMDSRLETIERYVRNN